MPICQVSSRKRVLTTAVPASRWNSLKLQCPLVTCQLKCGEDLRTISLVAFAYFLLVSSLSTLALPSKHNVCGSSLGLQPLRVLLLALPRTPPPIITDLQIWVYAKDELI